MKKLILLPTFATICMLTDYDKANEQTEITVENGEFPLTDFLENDVKE